MRDAILAWYDAQGRVLAFRGTSDPYAILVSEAMAQQTQAARAAEAWRRFMDEFPTFAALAAATPAAVLRAWRGLGYNRRALALRHAAVGVMEQHGGQLPRDLAALERLPGIGPYTARAVAALAFGQAVGAVDTNVRRVLIRTMVGDPRAWAGSPGAGAGAGAGSAGPAEAGVLLPQDLQALADRSVPPDRPGLWTHAVMDVGAVFCRPRNPRCDDCPAMAWCRTAAMRPAAAARPASIRDAARPINARPRTSRPVRQAPASFASTSRWLRGRILDRLRDAADGDWVELGEPIGTHGLDAILAALAALDREGLAQRHPARADLARLPTA